MHLILTNEWESYHWRLNSTCDPDSGMTDFEDCFYRTSEEVQECGVMTTEKAFDGAFSMAVSGYSFGELSWLLPFDCNWCHKLAHHDQCFLLHTGNIVTTDVLCDIGFGVP